MENCSRSIYVGNLPPDTTEDELRDVFSRVGAVVSVEILRNQFSRNPSSDACIVFTQRCYAHAAFENLNDTLLRDKAMRVMLSDCEEDDQRKVSAPKISAEVAQDSTLDVPSADAKIITVSIYVVCELVISIAVIVFESMAWWADGRWHKKHKKLGDLEGDQIREYQIFCSKAIMLLSGISMLVTLLRYLLPSNIRKPRRWRWCMPIVHLAFGMLSFGVGLKEYLFIIVQNNKIISIVAIVLAWVIFLACLIEIIVTKCICCEKGCPCLPRTLRDTQKRGGTDKENATPSGGNKDNRNKYKQVLSETVLLPSTLWKQWNNHRTAAANQNTRNAENNERVGSSELGFLARVMNFFNHKTTATPGTRNAENNERLGFMSRAMNSLKRQQERFFVSRRTDINAQIKDPPSGG